MVYVEKEWVMSEKLWVMLKEKKTFGLCKKMWLMSDKVWIMLLFVPTLFSQ